MLNFCLPERRRLLRLHMVNNIKKNPLYPSDIIHYDELTSHCELIRENWFLLECWNIFYHLVYPANMQICEYERISNTTTIAADKGRKGGNILILSMTMQLSIFFNLFFNLVIVKER